MSVWVAVVLKVLFRYLPSQIIPALVSFILIGVNAQYLGAEKFGIYTILITVVEVLCLFSHQWIKVGYIRHYSEFDGHEKVVFTSTADVLFFVVLLSVLFLCGVCVVLLEVVYEELILVGAFLYSSKTIYQYLQDKIRMHEQFFVYNVNSTIFSLASLIITVYVYEFYEVSVQHAILALAFSYILGFIVSFFKINLNFKYFSHEMVMMNVRYGLPLTISAILMQVLTKVDRYLIAYFMGAAAVGYYSAVVGLVFGLLSLVFTIVAAPLYPEIIKKSSEGSAKGLNECIKSYIFILMLVVIPSVVGFYSMSNDLVFFVLGKEYLNTASQLIFYVICASLLFNINAHLLSYGILISKKTYRGAYCSLASLICVVLLNYLLIPIFGLIGACYASVVALALSSVLMCFFSINHVKFSFPKKTISIVTSSFVMYMALLYSNSLFEAEVESSIIIVKVGIGVVVYMSMILLMSGGFLKFRRELNIGD